MEAISKRLTEAFGTDAADGLSIPAEGIVAVILACLDDRRYDGPLNCVAPGAVTNAAFTRELARALRRPVLPGMFVPRFALRLMVGEFADAALLQSHRVTPARLDELGFPFAARDLPTALGQVLGR